MRERYQDVSGVPLKKTVWHPGDTRHPYHRDNPAGFPRFLHLDLIGITGRGSFPSDTRAGHRRCQELSACRRDQGLRDTSLPRAAHPPSFSDQGEHPGVMPDLAFVLHRLFSRLQGAQMHMPLELPDHLNELRGLPYRRGSPPDSSSSGDMHHLFQPRLHGNPGQLQGHHQRDVQHLPDLLLPGESGLNGYIRLLPPVYSAQAPFSRFPLDLSPEIAHSSSVPFIIVVFQ